MNEDHPMALTFMSNLGWCILDQFKFGSESYFEFLIQKRTKPGDWKTYWVQLGCSLSKTLGSGDFTEADLIQKEAEKRFGPNHDRVQKGKGKIENIKTYLASQTS